MCGCKHFPANGSADPHLSSPVLDYSISDLENGLIEPFARAVEHGVGAVMISHVFFPKIDASYPATFSSAVIRDLLRERSSYNGIVLTDDLRMKALAENYEPEVSAVLALKAGADMLMYTGKDFNRLRDAVVNSVMNGELSADRLDEGEKNCRCKGQLRASGKEL